MGNVNVNVASPSSNKIKVIPFLRQQNNENVLSVIISHPNVKLDDDGLTCMKNNEFHWIKDKSDSVQEPRSIMYKFFFPVQNGDYVGVDPYDRFLEQCKECNLKISDTQTSSPLDQLI